MNPNLDGDAPLLRAEKLFKDFPSGDGRISVLRNINLTVRRGESVAITGPSGSGKSTLLGLLAGLEEPSGGDVFFDGRNLNGLSPNALAQIWNRRIGFIFQSYRLLPTLSAEENVRVPLELAKLPDAKSRALGWLGKVGLAARAGHLPAHLSGGEQQRVALARALAPGPDLLFADEPTGNLDGQTAQEMAELLFSLVRENRAALVLVTHEKDLAQRTGRILEIADGAIANEILTP